MKNDWIFFFSIFINVPDAETMCVADVNLHCSDFSCTFHVVKNMVFDIYCPIVINAFRIKVE